MDLQDLLTRAMVRDISVEGDPEGIWVTQIQLDSRLVQAGTLFAALPGSQVLGAQFAAMAAASGASAILAGHDDVLGETGDAIILRHPQPARVLSHLCSAFYGPLPERLVAVTGTNGKTSVVNFLRQIWQSSGISAASIGTLGVLPSGLVEVPELTSPDSVTLTRALSGLYSAGIKSVALEASSHGLDQHRLHGLRFDASGFTNFSQDHLDYHGDMAQYLAAKMKLFQELTDGPAVVNVDHCPDALIQTLEDMEPQRDILRVGRINTRTGTAPKEHLQVKFDASPTPSGLSLHLHLPAGGFRGSLKMVGLYQAENIAMAAGLALASGLTSDAIVEAIAGLTPAPGRMEWVTSHPGGGPILVDYAHTPDALVAALAATRPHVTGRIILVIGAGGDRDPLKRAPMGKIAAQHADLVIVTDDNPRSEDPASIRAAVMVGCPGAIEIGDRHQAIADAIGMMQPGDGLLIAGKGHETGQKIGDRLLPFDDSKVAAKLALTQFRP